MHTQPIPESAGKLGEPTPVPEMLCRQCGTRGNVVFQVWNSSCGGYVDEKYHCTACGQAWWVEGPDS